MTEIAITGDWHLTGEKKQFRFVNNVISKLDMPLILIGDLIDAGLNRGMNWDQRNVDVQIHDLNKILYEKTILGYVLGNHELRIRNLIGLNPFLDLLGEENNIIKIDKRLIVFEHGTRAPQNPLLQLEDLGIAYPKADLVAMGHNHTLLVYPRTDSQTLIRTGHLQLYPDYARRKILKQRPPGFIIYNTETNESKIMRV